MLAATKYWPWRDGLQFEVWQSTGGKWNSRRKMEISEKRNCWGSYWVISAAEYLWASDATWQRHCNQKRHVPLTFVVVNTEFGYGILERLLGTFLLTKIHRHNIKSREYVCQAEWWTVTTLNVRRRRQLTVIWFHRQQWLAVDKIMKIVNEQQSVAMVTKYVIWFWFHRQQWLAVDRRKQIMNDQQSVAMVE